jgi:mRNA-degrading endonuclease HigB of HigAB toxin-antitoxin module
MSIEKQELLKRLSFIKYLSLNADEQADKSEPLCNAAILSFHDSIELFLQLACEHLNINSSKAEFMEYFTLLENKITLTQTESMRRFNKARVSLKHHGTMVSKADIDSFKVSCRNFFIENTKSIYDIEFDTISLIDLVAYKRTKEYLLLAEKKLNDQDYEEAIKEATLAFWEMVIEYKENKIIKYGKAPTFLFSRDFGFISRSDTFITGENIKELTQYVKSSIDSIEKVLTILTLGIDYKKFTKFDLITPIYTRTMGGHIFDRGQIIEYNYDNVKWCFDFVIECCVSLQDFDYKISRNSDTTKKIINF